MAQSNNMVNKTIAFGCALIALGLGSWVVTGRESLTALIPAFAGILLAGLGLLGRKESLRMIAMHIAVVVALFGAIGAARGLSGLPELIKGEAERPAAVVAQVAMFVMCSVLVVVFVRSFIAARKAKNG